MKKNIDFTSEVEKLRHARDSSSFKKINIAVLSSYTIQNIERPLEYLLLEQHFDPSIKFGGYQQYNQELMDQSSWLYAHNPSVIVIALSTRSFFSGMEHRLLSELFEDLLSESIKKTTDLLNSISDYGHPAKFIVTTFDFPLYSPYGITDFQKPEGFFSLINQCNDVLKKHAKDHPEILLLNFDSFCKKIGAYNLTDEKMYYFGKLLLNNPSAHLFSKELVVSINAFFGNTKKCLVVDLDNTLWGGIIGEDGADGIIIGDSPVGSIYQEIQKTLLNYKKQGVLLAIVSKNNELDVAHIFEKKEMILKKEDFVTARINWEAKSENILSIANELNIGTDSFVFLDDSPVERLEVSTRLSDVEIIDFPADVSKLPAILKEMTFFSSINLTQEDKMRNEMYMQEKNRKAFQTTVSLEKYLKELKIQISIKKNDISAIERITQLINKTNQFNLRTKRYTEEQVREMMQSHNHAIFSVCVKDTFGDLGLTGVIIIQKIPGNEYFIDTFLLSCRILSRGIEKQFLFEVLKNYEGKLIQAEYIASPKNSQVNSFYDDIGFDKISSDGLSKRYSQSQNKITLNNQGWILVV